MTYNLYKNLRVKNSVALAFKYIVILILLRSYPGIG